MTTNRSIALVVEGIGSDATLTGGIAWYFGRSTIATPNSLEWVGGEGSGQGLVAPPSSVASSVDPFDLTFRGSAFTFKLHADIVAKLLWLPRPLEPHDSLSAAVDTDGTGFVFSGNGSWSSADDNRVVWIGDEAIAIGTHQAGSTFAGATRELFNTQAVYLPAGKSVYLANPRHLGRYCKVLVYDHDDGTVTQVWQGFISSFGVDGPVINIGAREVLTSTLNGKINRGVTSIGAAGIALPQLTTPGATGRVRLGLRPQGAQKRVNKTSAPDAHWLTLRVADAAVYAKWDDATSSATLQDGVPATAAGGASYRGSRPILGGVFKEEGLITELLVVDRPRDQFFGVNVYRALTDTGTYANMRSCTRELSYPFHPVAISLALLVSGPNPTPGAAGTGAAGANPPAAPGDTIAYDTNTQYFTGSDGHVVSMTAVNVAAGCIIGRQRGKVSAPHYKLIPDDGGAATWTMATTNMHTTGGRPGGAAVDAAGDYCYVIVDGEDGTWTATGRLYEARLDMADGTVDWSDQNGHGGVPSIPNSTNAMALAETAGDIYFDCSLSGDELRRDTMSTGAEVATSGTDSSLGACSGMCVTDDEAYVVWLGQSEYLGRWSLPLTGTATGIDDGTSGRIDVNNGVDTTLVWTAVGATEKAGRVLSTRNGDNKVWVCAGVGTTGQPWVMKYDPATGIKGTIDLEIDPRSDSDLTDLGTSWCLDIAVDQWGYLYLLYIDAGSATTTWKTDVIRYEPDGTFNKSFQADGITDLPRGTTHGGSGDLCTRIAVDEGGTVYVGDRGGYVWNYTQT